MAGLHPKLADVAQFRRGGQQGCMPSKNAPSPRAQRHTKRHARRWDTHLSTEASSRQSSTLKASIPSKEADVISLGSGRPNPEYYPWQSMTLTESNANDGLSNLPMSCETGESGFDFAEAMNYGTAAGAPQLLRFFNEHVQVVHDPPYADWETNLTCGTSSALDILLRMLCNRGDALLMEEYTYSGLVEAAKPLGLNIVGLEMDRGGLSPNALRSVLQNWDRARTPRPAVLYTVPTGHNPTGTTQSEARRRAIYEIAEEFDLIIVEDDPYHYLKLTEPECSLLSRRSYRLSTGEYLQSLPPSYLSLDTSGRVLRLDSTSKILAPGLRCSWMTGCRQLISCFRDHSDLNTVSPSGPSQIMLYKLLVESWGHEGFINWLAYLSASYSHRLATMIDACTMHLPGEICRWQVPAFGMFLWLEIDGTKHPRLRQHTGKDAAELWRSIEDSIQLKGRERGVLVHNGSWFAAEDKRARGLCFRVTFAAAPLDRIGQAIARLAAALNEEFEIEPGPG